ncbi:methylase involved in ubiquinone/menaquinone biosynthesis [Burkholderiales bacterium JOSHI_001]|nr:methylase involved in ubiquinone/menaquinone biosynthesis [Burkholderiales bacterium JOSHI_001]
MGQLNIAGILLSELTTTVPRSRVTEPELVMDDPSQVAAYAQAGREGGSLAPLYLYHTGMLAELIRPGDLVVDLACGPANQLAQVARVNPEARFLGIDLAPGMLAQARELVAGQALDNVEFKLCDISNLAFLPDHSVDVIMSTLSMHHLPDAALLGRVFDEIARVLKPGGAIYVADLGQLKSERSIAMFAGQYADDQPAVFTQDYLNSMRAAFSVGDFRRASLPIADMARVQSTFMVPYMVVVRSAPRREWSASLHDTLRAMKAALPAHQRRDLWSLRQFFRLGGVSSRYLA